MFYQVVRQPSNSVDCRYCKMFVGLLLFCKLFPKQNHDSQKHPDTEYYFKKKEKKKEISKLHTKELDSNIPGICYSFHLHLFHPCQLKIKMQKNKTK